MKFLFVCTHQIQNLIPLFVELNKKKEIDFKVLYWDKINQIHFDPLFNQKINFNINYFEGYNFHCLIDSKDNTKEISKILNKLLVSFKLVKYLLKENSDVILVYGYYFPHLITLMIAKLLGKKTVMRSVSYNLGKRNLIKRFLRHCYYRFTNLFINEFWSVNLLNTEFFINFAVNENKITLIPSSQINQEFVFKNNEEDFELIKNKTINENNLLINKKILLYSGKFIKKKRPIFLIEAFINANISDDWVLLLAGGGGFYHSEVLDLINKKKLKNVFFLGFKDLKEILVLYDMSEIVVLPSDFGETNGNVLLEASQFNCALIASDRVGLYPEILKNKIGLVFDAMNKNELSAKIEELTSNNKLREQLQKNNLEYSKKIQPSYAANKICEILKKNEV